MNMASSSSPPMLLIIILSILSLLISFSESTEHVVGDGEFVWKVPLSSPDALILWSSSHNFTVGDTIIFPYNIHRESVREVMNENDFIKCNTKGSFMRLKQDGNTKVVLNKLGVHYFMSGWKSHCKRGLKVAVDVMSPTTPSSLPSPTLVRPALTLPQSSTESLLLSPSPSPSPSPNFSGSKGGAIGCGFIIWLGVSLMTMMLLLI